MVTQDTDEDDDEEDDEGELQWSREWPLYVPVCPSAPSDRHTSAFSSPLAEVMDFFNWVSTGNNFKSRYIF